MNEKAMREVVANQAKAASTLLHAFGQSLEDLAAVSSPASSLAKDLANDYKHLEVVREIWQSEGCEAFCESLLNIWRERAKAAGYPTQFSARYEPGDYIQAAREAQAKAG